MPVSSTIRYGFRIRTRQGTIVDKLVIHGRDEADAEKKLRQIYRHCEVIARETLEGSKKRRSAGLAGSAALLRRPSAS